MTNKTIRLRMRKPPETKATPATAGPVGPREIMIATTVCFGWSLLRVLFAVRHGQSLWGEPTLAIAIAAAMIWILVRTLVPGRREKRARDNGGTTEDEDIVGYPAFREEATVAAVIPLWVNGRVPRAH